MMFCLHPGVRHLIRDNGYAKWHLDAYQPAGPEKGVFVSIWTSAGEFWTSAVQERDKLSNDRLYKIVDY